jgi:hypothetical protein
MDNFNPASLVRNLASNLIQARQSQNIANMPQGQQGSPTGAAPSTPQPAVRTIIPLQPVTPLTIQNMNMEQKVNYVRDTLQLPREFKELMQELTRLTAQAQQGKGGVTSNMLQLAMMSKMLGDNANVAVQKLMQVISNAARAGVADTAQLREILSILNSSLAGAGSSSAADTVKSIILLYLPWLPLNSQKQYPLDFNLNFFDEDDPNSQGGEHIETVGILIQTQHYGNISAILEAKKGDEVTVLLNCIDTFPHKMFEKLFSERTRAEGIESEIITQEIKQAENLEKREQPSVKMNAQSAISQQLLLASYTLIRLTIELDRENTGGDSTSSEVD